MKEGMLEGKREGMREGMKRGVEEGMKECRAFEAREFILRLGKPRFGLPSEAIRERLASISELDRLESLVEKLFGVSGWEELLSEP